MKKLFSILFTLVLALSLNMVTAVPVAAADVNPGDSIQTAINAASPGDTINVAAGTYNESININKSLTLQGAGATSTTISGTGGTVVTISANDVLIDGFTITNGGVTGYAIYAADHSNITITNNIVTAIGNGSDDVSGRGIVIVSSASPVDSVSITNNHINNIVSGLRTGTSSTSAVGIAIGWSTGDYDITNLLIRNNEISDITADTSDWTTATKGQGAYGILINHGTGTTGKTVDARVLDNTISKLEGLWAHGIGLEGNTPGAVVQGNDISNLTDHKSPSDAVAVQVEDNASADTVGIHFNNFYELNVGVQNVTGIMTDATNNWWGDKRGPSRAMGKAKGHDEVKGDRVSPNVRFAPWLQAPVDLEP